MKITTLINELQQLNLKHGDIPVSVVEILGVDKTTPLLHIGAIEADERDDENVRCIIYTER